jgi:hypothetical protein
MIASSKSKQTVNLSAYQSALGDGVRSGKYVRVLADTSGQISVHIVIARLEKDGVRKSDIVDKDVNTNAYFASGPCNPKTKEYCFDRDIVWSRLSPGRYRVQVTTLEDTPRFDGVDARIQIGFHPNERPFD